jgi:hypothetical protein
MARNPRIEPTFAIEGNYSDDDGESGQLENQKSRMVDWLQSIKLPFTMLFVVPVIAILPVETIFKDTHSVGTSIFVVIWFLVSLATIAAALIVQLIGFSFNAEKNLLSYPYYFLRRKVHLSEIDDANCQVVTKQGFDLASVIGERTSGPKTTKRYDVNLSGEFGARRIVFHSKYKRDEFLSLIRKYAPHVRITRWS